MESAMAAVKKNYPGKKGGRRGGWRFFYEQA
jgi:hypothetical protein